jgi:hypothetical protein
MDERHGPVDELMRFFRPRAAATSAGDPQAEAASPPSLGLVGRDSDPATIHPDVLQAIGAVSAMIGAVNRHLGFLVVWDENRG